MKGFDAEVQRGSGVRNQGLELFSPEFHESLFESQ
ncbi:hypothetical protein Hgul01_01699 [Herpetosiphon gulosus]|uniref:Uncharacterized protein n=1 Tax=Herpetosiphon gulosus TaxID=1973496 RepID=A0ABP9X0R8_9CHLR